MGAQCARRVDDDLDESELVKETPVQLHLYDLGTSFPGQAVNTVLRLLGTGAFHCGVEVFGQEYSFSYCFHSNFEPYEGTGVFSSTPRECEGHSYCQTLSLGTTRVSEAAFALLLRSIEKDWPAKEYDILSRNCGHFADDFAERLGADIIPDWVTKLSQVGTALSRRNCTSAGSLCCDQVVSACAQKPCTTAGSLLLSQVGSLLAERPCVSPTSLCCKQQSLGTACLSSSLRKKVDPWKDDLIAALSVRTRLGCDEDSVWNDCRERRRPSPSPGLMPRAAPSPKAQFVKTPQPGGIRSPGTAGKGKRPEITPRNGLGSQDCTFACKGKPAVVTSRGQEEAAAGKVFKL